jgi:hypothetical protein
MIKTFKVGDHVAWNSEAGVRAEGYIHHERSSDPLYEIKSGKTDHAALHKGTAFRRMGRQ